MSINNLGMYFGICEDVKRWEAERENASARLELVKIKRCQEFLISQHEPVFSLGIDRTKLQVLLSFLGHRDTARLRRECEVLIGERHE